MYAGKTIDVSETPLSRNACAIGQGSASVTLSGAWWLSVVSDGLPFKKSDSLCGLLYGSQEWC